MASHDPVKCKCKNACTRVRGREGDRTRGVCACKENGTPCTYLCSCGTEKFPCSNQDYNESDDEEDFREDADGTDDLCDPLYVAFEQMAEVNEAVEKEPSRDKGRKNKTTQEKSSTAGAQGMHMTKRNKKLSEAQRRSEAEVLKSQITELTTDGIKNLVLKLADLYPDLVGMAIGPNPPEPPPHTGQDGWCKCFRCREMPTLIEHQCCISTYHERCILYTSGGPINQLVLSRTALEVAVLNHNEYCIQNDNPNDNDTLRHMAYRKYILWSRGYLGAGVREVIPSCVVWAIRDKYPSADGRYTGYKPSR